MTTELDELLNRAMAETLGWTLGMEKRFVGYKGDFHLIPFWVNPHGKHGTPPDYCNDRNALPEIWAIFEQSETRKLFWRELEKLTAHRAYKHFELPGWVMMTAEPRRHVVAALKALGKCPAEFDHPPPSHSEREWREPRRCPDCHDDASAYRTDHCLTCLGEGWIR